MKLLNTTIAAVLLILAYCLSVVLQPNVTGEDWPVFQHDNYRSAKTTENLQAELLEPAWIWQSPHPPQPAWSGPATVSYTHLRAHET